MNVILREFEEPSWSRRKVTQSYLNQQRVPKITKQHPLPRNSSGHECLPWPTKVRTDRTVETGDRGILRQPKVRPRGQRSNRTVGVPTTSRSVTTEPTRKLREILCKGSAKPFTFTTKYLMVENNNNSSSNPTVGPRVKRRDLQNPKRESRVTGLYSVSTRNKSQKKENNTPHESPGEVNTL